MCAALGLHDDDAKSWDAFVLWYERKGEAKVRGSEKREYQWGKQMVDSDWLLARLQGHDKDEKLKLYPRQHLLSIAGKAEGKWLWKVLAGFAAAGLKQRMEALCEDSGYDAWRLHAREEGLRQLGLRGEEREAECTRHHLPPPHLPEDDGMRAPEDSVAQVKP